MTSAVESAVFNNSEECIAAGTRSGSIKVFDLTENKGRYTSMNTHCIPVNTLYSNAQYLWSQSWSSFPVFSSLW